MRFALLALTSLLWTASAEAQQGPPSCRSDDALTELAAAVAAFARDHDGRAPSSASLSRALRASGSGFPTVSVHVARVGPSTPPPTSSSSRCGLADAGTGGARFRASIGAIEEATWSVSRRGGSYHLRALVAPHMTHVEAFSLDERGDARRVALARDGPFVIARVTEAELPVRLQISASDGRGPRPVVTVDLPTAMADAAALRALLAPADPMGASATDDPTRLVHRVARVRDEAGAPRLRPNRLLTRLGREHAQAMCNARRVAHVVDARRGDLEARAARIGLFARSLGEAVARSNDASGALRAVLSSPSHRALVLDRRWTDFGAGTAPDARGRTCLVLVLAAWPRLGSVQR